MPAMVAVSLSVASKILYWDGMMLELKHVGDPLAAYFSHENLNATIGICSMP